MWFFYLLAVPAVLAVVVYMLRAMPSPKTPWHVKLDVGLAWFTALSALILVPVDVASAYHGGQADADLRVWWLAAYWYSFAVQVLVLPLHSEYADSCEFTVGDRVAYSLRSNLTFYAVAVAAGGVGLVALLATHTLGPGQVAGYVIALSNAYGLVASLFLMGFGLVAIPRHLWRGADPREVARQLQRKAGRQADKVTSAYKGACDAAGRAERVAEGFGRRDALRPYMDKVLETLKTAAPEVVPAQQQPAGRGGRLWGLAGGGADEDESLDYLSRRDLAALRRALRHTMDNYERQVTIYLAIVRQYIQVQGVLSQMEAGPPPLLTRPGVGGDGGGLGAASVASEVLAQLRWWWHCRLRKWTMRVLSVVCWALCAAFVAAEVTIDPPGNIPNLSAFAAALRRCAAGSGGVGDGNDSNNATSGGTAFWQRYLGNATSAPGSSNSSGTGHFDTGHLGGASRSLGGSGGSMLLTQLAGGGGSMLLTQLAAFAFLSYPCGAAYYALYRAGRFSFYLLVPGHTPTASLCSNATFMARFAPPLAFHFIYAIAMPPLDKGAPDLRDTVFYQEIGQHIMQAPIFGLQFTTWLPLAMAPYMLLLVTGAFNRVVAMFGRGGRRMAFEDDWDGADSAAIGLRLLAAEYEADRCGEPLGKTLQELTAGVRQQQGLQASLEGIDWGWGRGGAGRGGDGAGRGGGGGGGGGAWGGIFGWLRRREDGEEGSGRGLGTPLLGGRRGNAAANDVGGSRPIGVSAARPSSSPAPAQGVGAGSAAGTPVGSLGSGARPSRGHGRRPGMHSINVESDDEGEATGGVRRLRNMLGAAFNFGRQ